MRHSSLAIHTTLALTLALSVLAGGHRASAGGPAADGPAAASTPTSGAPAAGPQPEAAVAPGEPDRPPGAATGPAPAPAAGAAAMRIYIDPETGRPGTPPEGLEPELTAEQHLTLSTDAAELYEEPSPVPGGGTMIDLQGRFQSVMHGTLGADDVLVTDCDHSGAEGGAR